MYYPFVIENRCNASAGVVRDTLRETLGSWKFAQSIGITVHSNFVTLYGVGGLTTADLRQLFSNAQCRGDMQRVLDEYSNYRDYHIFFVDERFRLYSKFLSSDDKSTLVYYLGIKCPFSYILSSSDEGHYRKEF